MQFSDFPLDPCLLKAAHQAGYLEATPIQEQAIPLALAGHDIIGTAQTGTGKTAAFVLPILHALLTRPSPTRCTRALIITPTRELAEQIHTVIDQMSYFTELRSATIYGGVDMSPQISAIKRGTEILVACPGRLLDHMTFRCDFLQAVDQLVLDEADRMLDMGFLPDVRRIIAKVPASRQTMFFSATFAPELDRLTGDILRHPRRVQVGIAQPAQTVNHQLCPVAQEKKVDLLLKLLRTTAITPLLVFTRTKLRADRLFRELSRAGFRAAALHSDLSQEARQAALAGFRNGRFQLLVATDIASRGLDIENISHVINFDIPGTPNAYIHRIGRTGRAEKAGDALTFITGQDRGLVREIERTLGRTIPVKKIAGFDLEEKPAGGHRSRRPGQGTPGGHCSSSRRRRRR